MENFARATHLDVKHKDFRMSPNGEVVIFRQSDSDIYNTVNLISGERLNIPDRKNISICDNKKAIEFLKNYEWSSYKDYFGKGSRGSIVNKDLFYEQFDVSPETYEKELLDLSTCEVDELGFTQLQQVPF